MSFYDLQPAPLRLHPIRTGNAWEWEIDLLLRDDDTQVDTPLDLTLADARFQIRKRASDPVALVSLTQAEGIVLLGPTVLVSLSSAVTATLAVQPAEVVWDLQLRMPGGDWWTPVQGPVAIVQGVSRE